jgi:carboxyl-terminal processing protease
VRAVQAAAVAAAIVAVLCIGLWWGGHPTDLPDPLRDVFVDDAVSLNAEARGVIEDNYFRKVGSDPLTNASIDGMVRALRQHYHDRFSHYFDPEDLSHFEEAISGRFSGVGLSVSELKRGLRVERVFPHSPAERAGIEPGDVVVSVNGKSIAGVDSTKASEMIRGPIGTKVTIGVLHPPSRRPRQVSLKRAKIQVPVAAGRVRTVNGHKLGYVQFVTFSKDSHEALRSAVQRVRRKGAQGIVLDLRGNGGGLLPEAQLTASIFLPKGDVVVSTRSRTQGERTFKTVGGNLPEMPIVVLIDHDTASAAEILTAALADDAGAPVVGTRSFGKGVFQNVIGLSNGGALDLTTGEFFTPSGENLAGKGVHPDVKAGDNPKTPADEALDSAFGTLSRELNGAATESGGG